MYYLGKIGIKGRKTDYSIYTKDTLGTMASDSIEEVYFNYINDNFRINDIDGRDWKFNPTTKSMSEDDTIYECIFEFSSLETFKDDYPEYFI